MKNSKPEKFLETEELSALENQSLTGGVATIASEDDKKKKKEKKVVVES